MCYTIAKCSKKQFHFDITYIGNTFAKGIATCNVAYEAIKYMKDDLKWNPQTIEKALNPEGGNGIGAFWKPKASNGEQTSGYTKELVFDKENTYYVHTQRYSFKIFEKLKTRLEELGFTITLCN